MLVFKFTCEKGYHLNADLVASKFAEAIGDTVSKDIAIKTSPNVVKLYLGEKNKNNISTTIFITDEDIEDAIVK